MVILCMNSDLRSGNLGTAEPHAAHEVLVILPESKEANGQTGNCGLGPAKTLYANRKPPFFILVFRPLSAN